jgi:hypothetical protein
MAEPNSTLVRSSRYTAGGTSEVNSKAIEWWERDVIPVDASDTVYVVEAQYVGRLDQIAAIYLLEPRYWWIIAQYNNVLDPYNEIQEGTILYIPSIDRVKSLVSGKTGGVPSTREVPLSILPIV